MVSTMKRQDLSRGITGFVRNIIIDKDDFICQNCGPTPKYIVGDAKLCNMKKLVNELGPKGGDRIVLSRGSKYKDRLFLGNKKERTTFLEFLSENIDIDNLLNSSELKSENSKLLTRLLARVTRTFPENLPAPYKKIITNICKNSSVSGLLQVTREESLDILEDFSNQTIDLRSLPHQEKLSQISEELPAFWPNLLHIMDLEGTKFLPEDISTIVLKLIEIRRDIFLNAPFRNESDYPKWENPSEEHPSQYYPNWPLFRHPKEYNIKSSKKQEKCNKNFTKEKNFRGGIFSVGCYCKLNITLGFEVMASAESEHNFFRLLMCRDLDFEALEGVVYDFGCGLDEYLLNREPREFEFLRCLGEL